MVDSEGDDDGVEAGDAHVDRKAIASVVVGWTMDAETGTRSSDLRRCIDLGFRWN